MLPRYRFAFVIPTNTRQLVLSVWIGRSKREATFSRIRVLLEGDCRVRLNAPVRFRDDFSGTSGAAATLASDRGLANLLSGLIRKRVMSNARWVFHPDPQFLLTPEDDTRARATLDTLEQDWKGGFVVKLGLDGFLTALDRIESRLGGPSSARRSA
jgi:hypothetical protein